MVSQELWGNKKHIHKHSHTQWLHKLEETTKYHHVTLISPRLARHNLINQITIKVIQEFSVMPSWGSQGLKDLSFNAPELLNKVEKTRYFNFTFYKLVKHDTST